MKIMVGVQHSITVLYIIRLYNCIYLTKLQDISFALLAENTSGCNTTT